MDLETCEFCERGTRAETLSEHPTSQGKVVYSRCVCGSVRMFLIPYATDRRTMVGAAPPRSG
jgi:hypothetical protein